MPDLPTRLASLASSPATDQERHAVAARRAVEQGLHNVTLSAHFHEVAVEIEASAARGASEHCLDVELRLLFRGLAAAGDSAAAAKLVADRVQLLSQTNSRLIERHFQ